MNEPTGLLRRLRTVKASAATAVTVLVAILASCGGKVDPSADESSTRSGVNAGAGNGGAGGGGGGGGAADAPPSNTIPTGPARPAGAVGATPCSPFALTAAKTTKPTPALIVGQAWNSTVYVIDSDPDHPGRHRAFISHYPNMQRHALSEDGAPDTFIIDRGLPNQITLTKTTIAGAGEDGALITPVSDEQLAVFSTFIDESPESLAYAPNPLPYGPGAKHLFVFGPVTSGGVLGVPRVFYGEANAIKERAFLGFGPADSSATATAASSVTFDVDGTPTTLPTVVTRETQGLINGFGSSGLTFLCF